MCSVSSELVVKLGSIIEDDTFNINDLSKRKKHKIIIDAISNDSQSYGFEILNLKFKSNESSSSSNDIKNEFFIKFVHSNSSAFHANLMNNDRIIEINGHNVSKMDLSEVQFLIKESKRTYDGKIHFLIDRLENELITGLSKSNSFGNFNSFAIQTRLENIMNNSNHIFWVYTRKVFKSTILTGLVALCLFMLAVIIVHPKCEQIPKSVWWKNALIYKIRLQNLCSTNETGKCFNKLIEKIDYFSQLNANVLMLTNIIDLSENLTILNNEYGSKDEFIKFLNYSHINNIKIFIDFIPNYTTNDNNLFKLSFENEKYKDYFIWSKEPNNWVDNQNNSMWTKVNNDYYLHSFGLNKPDLNYRNEKVFDRLMDAIKYWSDFGVDGFNIIGASYLFKDKNDIKLSRNHRENFYLIAELKKKIEPKILILDSFDTEYQNENIIVKYYGDNYISGFDLIPNDVFKVSQEAFINSNSSYENKKLAWMINHNSLDKINDYKELSSLYATVFTLPGAIIIDFDSFFYQYLLLPNENKQIELKKSHNHTFNQHKTYDIENLIKKLSTIRSKLNSLLIGHSMIFEKENVISIHRYISIEKNVILFFNKDKQHSKNIETCCKEYCIKQSTAIIEYSNTDSLQGEIEFNNDYKPSKNIILCPYCTIILSYNFKPLDIKEIF